MLTNKNKSDQNDEIIKLLEENIKVSREILKLSKKTQFWVHWQIGKSIFYFFIFLVIPITLLFVYLPPLMSDLAEEYQKIMGIILPQQQEIIKAIGNGK